MKILLLTLSLAIASFRSYAQNSDPWPTSGNVGIGTTNPGSKLNVVGVSATPPNMSYMSTGYIPFKVQTRSDHNYGLSVFDSNTNTAIQSGDIVNGTGTTNLNFQPFGGNVGIGTTSPGYKLDVNGSMNIGNISSGSNAILNFSTNASGGPRSITYRAADASMSIDNTGGNALMTIQNGGNVGIGTTSPGARLHVNGDAYTEQSVFGQTSMSLNHYYAGSNYIDFKWYGASLGYIKQISGSSLELNSINGLAITGGNVGVGTTSPDEKLTVKGKIHSQEVIVNAMTTVPDYVFSPEYELTSLDDVKAYVDKNHHLPEIPSAKEIEKNGISLGAMNMKLLKKIEELTLYLIEKDNKDKQKDAQLLFQQELINQLKEQVTALTKAKN